MSKTPNYDARIQAILDGLKPQEQVCPISGETWQIDAREIAWCRFFRVPPSKHAPLTRMRLLTMPFFGGQWWYNRHADTGKPIITGVHPATGVRVLPDKEWFDRDFSSAGMDLDHGKPFLDQLKALQPKVPHGASGNYEEAENSIAVASMGDVNSYFVIASKSKNTMYAVVALDVENSAEVYNCSSVNNSYSVVDSQRIYNCQYVRESHDCMDSAFLFDCRRCEHCFGATNKRNGKYLWFNEQLSKEEWERRRAAVDLGSRLVAQEYLQKFRQLMREQGIWPENFNERSENCVGEYLTGCVDCYYTFYGTEGARHNDWCAWAIGRAEDNAYVAEPNNSQECYFSSAMANCRGARFCLWNSRCQNMEYSEDCYDCENCFGCIGLRKKKFHILNKPYAEADYWAEVDRLKCRMLEEGTYGEFLPVAFSLSYYPESGAVKYYLADMAFGEKTGAIRFKPEDDGAIGEELMGAREIKDASELPDHCRDLEGWASVPLYDAAYKRRFSLIRPEIALYQQLGVAPPTQHPIVRVTGITMEANSGVMGPAACAKCGTSMVVAKNATYVERTIYCKACYLEYLEQHG